MKRYVILPYHAGLSGTYTNLCWSRFLRVTWINSNKLWKIGQLICTTTRTSYLLSPHGLVWYCTLLEYLFRRLIFLYTYTVLMRFIHASLGWHWPWQWSTERDTGAIVSMVMYAPQCFHASPLDLTHSLILSPHSLAQSLFLLDTWMKASTIKL